jgi:hypothetical protein
MPDESFQSPIETCAGIHVLRGVKAVVPAFGKFNFGMHFCGCHFLDLRDNTKRKNKIKTTTTSILASSHATAVS